MSQSTGLNLFTAPGGSRVRAAEINGQPALVGADLCLALGLTGGARNALARLPERMKGVANVNTPGGAQAMTCVTEAGAYRLIMRSNVPGAQAIQDWLAEEVLPAIRRTGSYGVAPAVPQSLPEALRAYAVEVEAREAAERELETARPAVAAYETYLDARGAKLVNVVAQEMKTGQNRLFKFLREHRVLKSQPGDTYNLPYQHHIDCGRFTVVAATRLDRNDEPVATHTTYVTPKGEAFIFQLIKKHGRP